ncbi:MAG: hypothetical protein HC828_02135 [Blastochloris sp.]|nr:hypothetical protein [Blastochloris sp.]
MLRATWMLSPPWPSDADPYRPALARANHAALALRLVADKRGRPIATLRRELSRRDLEYELALLLYAFACEQALDLVRDDTEPPEGRDLISRVIQARYAQLMEAKREAIKVEAQRRMAEEIARRKALATG